MQIVCKWIKFAYMKNEVFISIFLDTRRPKANGKFPVKLRVFTPLPRKQKLYKTNYDFTGSEFESIWNTNKTKTEHKAIKYELQEIEKKAIEISNTLDIFTFEAFEKKYLRNNGDGSNVFYHYQKYIAELTSFKQFGTASNYNLSQKSILNFLKDVKKINSSKLHFQEISTSWLKEYQFYMIETCKKSYTTLSMYVRALRTIYNKAIESGDIDKELYPFGKSKYVIPSMRSVKRALSKEDLKVLYYSEPKTTEQAKAKDFWFLSYLCNGINIKDLANLKWGDIKGETIEFLRQKTKQTSVANLKPVSLVYSEYTKNIIEKYGNVSKEKDQLIFPFISKGKTDKERFNSVKNFTKFINQHMKKLALDNNVSSDISTYWARHSFATIAIQNGASKEQIQESMSHSSVKTTELYFAGFEDSTKIEINKKLLQF